ncbi:hypothetical protein VNO78_03117 [Psophocarpus tetragonolobus]|uniref:Uncharacterized protein n=1 Tax=Psophocarpus tetragonolobus TaxID=3891 RepID=A0AAN9T025_PSOTE
MLHRKYISFHFIMKERRECKLFRMRTRILMVFCFYTIKFIVITNCKFFDDLGIRNKGTKKNETVQGKIPHTPFVFFPLFSSLALRFRESLPSLQAKNIYSFILLFVCSFLCFSSLFQDLHLIAVWEMQLLVKIG